MKKKSLVLLVLVLMIGVLSGCKASAEKIAEAENSRNELIAARDAAEEKYLDLADTSLRPELDKLGVQVSEVQETDFSKMSNKKIDAYLPTITSLLDGYKALQTKLDGTYNEEEAQNIEAAKNVQIDSYIVNKMGVGLKSIVLHDLTTDLYSDNLLGNDSVLASGYTLMGIKLQIHTDSENWEFVVTDEGGTTYNLPSESLKNSVTNGLSLVFEMDEENKTGKVTLGGYFSN